MIRGTGVAAWAALALLGFIGCSHKPRPAAAFPEAQAATRVPDSTFTDSGEEKAQPDSAAGSSTAPAGRRPSRAGSAEPGNGVQTGASSSAAPAQGPAASASAPAAGARDTLRAADAPLAPLLPESAELTLQRDTRKAVDEARARLAKVDEKKLDEEKRKKLKIATDFVAEAERALERKEYERAAGLASKARLLAEELSGS